MVRSGMPYQCTARLGNILIGARGSSIDCLNLEDGSLLSTWTSEKAAEAPIDAPPLEKQKSESSSVDITLDSAPPTKKRRLSKGPGEDEEEEEKVPVKDGKKKSKKNNRANAIVSGLEAPAITCLAVTKDGKHVVGVTGEDKSIRVFENIVEDGKKCLKQLSQRMMPKRPCAIAITKDSKTIISADKFGDVYSLPLIPSDVPVVETPEPVTAPKPFVPSANEFTIHSERNRKALENQRRHIQNRPQAQSNEPNFEHKLLLGHVSMLTDIILAEYEGRDYILTADRDEHIRISRGIPQADIIEGYCLGHKEFVSRLCVATYLPNTLVSGGGDNALYLWDWTSNRLLSKIPVLSLMQNAVNSTRVDEDLSQVTDLTSVKPAVRSIDHLSIPNANANQEFIIISLEGFPVIFVFLLSSDMNGVPALKHHSAVPLKGNCLSITILDSGFTVSVDTIHKSFSTTEPRTSNAEPLSLGIQRFKYAADSPTFWDESNFGADSGNAREQVEIGDGARVRNLLYGLENLRKREGGEDGGAEEEGAAEG